MKVLHVTRTLAQEMLGPMVLSRVVKNAGHEMRAICLPDPRWLKKIREYAPDVITYSVMTGTHRQILAVNRFLKARFSFFSILGGPHPTFVPEIVKEPGVDAVCVGEGEGALLDLLEARACGADWREIANLAWCDDAGDIHKNPPRPLVRDLDSLGLPDSALIYDAQPLYRNNPRKVIVTQRGCPMNCSFCFHHAWRGKVYNARVSSYVRKRSVDSVIAEAQDIRSRWPLSFVHFVDDIFNIDSQWLQEFCTRWPREVGLPFDAILMANMTREEHIRQLSEAGCVYARIAFEAANDHIRNDIFRKNTTRKQLIDASGWIKRYGIRLGSLNMLGAPGGTLDDEFETIQLNAECQVDHPLCSIVQPYPQYDLNDITKGMGYAVDHYDELPSQFNRRTSIEVPNRRAIENLHKWFPVLVRHPKLVPLARRTLNSRVATAPLLAMYALWSEWLVTEQNGLYLRAQGKRGPRTWGPVDFTTRVATKSFLRLVGTVGGRVVERLSTRMQMDDERVLAHAD